jgi:DNA-binding XRE family transcriptional regulator
MERESPSDTEVGGEATLERAPTSRVSAAPGTNDPVLANFIANLRRMRRAAGMTQEALAEACQMERTYISYLERGLAEPKLGMIVRLAEGLRVSPAALLADIVPGQDAWQDGALAMNDPSFLI